jgi:hypothetical protein
MEKQIMNMSRTTRAIALASMVIAVPAVAHAAGSRVPVPYGGDDAYASGPYASMDQTGMSRHGRVDSRYDAAVDDLEAHPRLVGGRICIPAPRVGAFATQPWTNDTPCEPSY